MAGIPDRIVLKHHRDLEGARHRIWYRRALGALLAVFLLFGASRLPELAKSLGQSNKAFRDEMREAALYYEQRRLTAGQASDRDLRDAAEAHREIYRAIKKKNVDAARRAMNDHLLRASAYQRQERARRRHAALKGKAERSG